LVDSIHSAPVGVSSHAVTKSLCYLRGGVTEGLRRDGEGVGVYSLVERRGGVLLLQNKSACISIKHQVSPGSKTTHSSRGAFRSSSTFLLLFASDSDFRSIEGGRLFLGGVIDLETDRDLLRERLRRTDLLPEAGGVADPSLVTGRREGGVELASDLLLRRGGVREGDRDLERSLDGDLPLRFSAGRSSSSKYRPRLGTKSGFLSSSR
jgi:hypothetical protein